MQAHHPWQHEDAASTPMATAATLAEAARRVKSHAGPGVGYSGTAGHSFVGDSELPGPMPDPEASALGLTRRRRRNKGTTNSERAWKGKEVHGVA